eukprot:gene51985-69560_t
MFDGSSFAKNGVVTVTINYVLNVFGFLASPSLEGIFFGPMDQIQGSVVILPKSLLEDKRPEQPRFAILQSAMIGYGLLAFQTFNNMQPLTKAVFPTLECPYDDV